jgi:hypothetical protein
MSESYRFSPRPRGTIIGPLALRHIVGLGLVAILSVGLIVVWPSYVTVAIAMVVIVLMIIALWFPVLNGMTVADLVPPMLSYLRDSITGRRDWKSPAAFQGIRDRMQMLGRVPPPLDRAGIRLLGGRDLGIIEDTKRQTWTGLLRISGQAFDLLTAEHQEALASGWMNVLADYCRSGDYVTRLQWVTRSVPDGGEAHLAWLKSSGAKVDDEYEQLLEQHSTDTMRHEFYIAVTISLRRTADAVRGAWNVQMARERVLFETLSDLADKLSSAGVSVDGYLGASDLTAVIRRGYVPDTADRHTNEGLQLKPEQAWPTAIEAQWDFVRADDAYHAIYWVDEYPRIDVGLGFLTPLLAATGVRRTVSMILQPMDLTTSQRQAEASLVAQMSAKKERETRGKLQIVRMYGQQAAGLAFSLPIGLGLKDRSRIGAL